MAILLLNHLQEQWDTQPPPCPNILFHVEPHSHLISFPTLFSFSELPGAPTNLGISNIGPRSVTLQFRPGYDGKTSISRWLVEAQVKPAGGEPQGPESPPLPSRSGTDPHQGVFSQCEFSWPNRGAPPLMMGLHSQYIHHKLKTA